LEYFSDGEQTRKIARNFNCQTVFVQGRVFLAFRPHHAEAETTKGRQNQVLATFRKSLVYKQQWELLGERPVPDVLSTA
jgi:hypothetical protein